LKGIDVVKFPFVSEASNVDERVMVALTVIAAVTCAAGLPFISITTALLALVALSRISRRQADA
jgi:hypothetical protein